MSCECWELNLGPLQEQPARLTTEPSLKALLRLFLAGSYGDGALFFVVLIIFYFTYYIIREAEKFFNSNIQESEADR